MNYIDPFAQLTSWFPYHLNSCAGRFSNRRNSKGTNALRFVIFERPRPIYAQCCSRKCWGHRHERDASGETSWSLLACVHRNNRPLIFSRTSAYSPNTSGDIAIGARPRPPCRNSTAPPVPRWSTAVGVVPMTRGWGAPAFGSMCHIDWSVRFSCIRSAHPRSALSCICSKSSRAWWNVPLLGELCCHESKWRVNTPSPTQLLFARLHSPPHWMRWWTARPCPSMAPLPVENRARIRAVVTVVQTNSTSQVHGLRTCGATLRVVGRAKCINPY